MTFKVRYTRQARDDLRRLFAHLAQVDPALAKKTRLQIGKAVDLLRNFPFTCRKASPADNFLRELVMQFGASGYVALFDIENGDTVTILAVRHQREDDFFD